MATIIMSNTVHYSLGDLSNVTISFATIVGMTDMYDAIFSMSFEKGEFERKKEMRFSELFFVMLNGIIIFIIKSISSEWIFNDSKYANLLNFTILSILSLILLRINYLYVVSTITLSTSAIVLIFLYTLNRK